MQNFSTGHGYTLSKAKRDRLFSELTDAEVAVMEMAIHTAFESA